MQDLNDLRYFAAIVDHGGFSAASRALDVPKSKLSRRIAALEHKLSVRLLQRSTRHLRVTEIGQQFYAHCKAMLVEADAAEAVVAATHAEPCGSVHVSCPIALLHMHVGAMLTDFATRYPQVRLQVTAINRAVDVLGEGIDIALRVRPLPLQDSDLALRVLGTSTQLLVASPKLLTRLVGAPTDPNALGNWPSLGNGAMATKYVWKLSAQDGRQLEVHHMPRLTTTDMGLLRQAALQGLGVVQLPQLVVDADLHRGDLVQLLPDWSLPPETIHAVFASPRGLISSVRALIDHLADGFSQHA